MDVDEAVFVSVNVPKFVYIYMHVYMYICVCVCVYMRERMNPFAGPCLATARGCMANLGHHQGI